MTMMQAVIQCGWAIDAVQANGCAATVDYLYPAYVADLAAVQAGTLTEDQVRHYSSGQTDAANPPATATWLIICDSTVLTQIQGDSNYTVVSSSPYGG